MTKKNSYLAPLLDVSPAQLPGEVNKIAEEQGIQAAYNAILRTRVALTNQKPTLAIYDHTGHIIGGGQKYGFTVAHALKDLFDVNLILNKKITRIFWIGITWTCRYVRLKLSRFPFLIDLARFTWTRCMSTIVPGIPFISSAKKAEITIFLLITV